MKKAVRHQLSYPMDSRGIAQPDVAIDELKSLLWDDYVLPINQSDPEFKTDGHHLYYSRANYKPINNDWSLIPYFFRDQHWNLIVLQRQTHNMWHDVFKEPRMPRQDIMAEEMENHNTHRRAILLAKYAAMNAAELQPHFISRRSDIANHPERIGERDQDTIGEAYLRTKFEARHSWLQESLDQLESCPDLNKFYPDLKIPNRRASVIALHLGKISTQRSISFVDRFLTQEVT